MHKIKNIIIATLIILSSCGNRCDNACNEWEECVRGYCDFLGCIYSCESILRKYSQEYLGEVNIIYENFNEVFNSKIRLGTIQDDPSNYSRIFLEHNDSINPIDANNEKINLYLIFSDQCSGEFTIPRQTISCPIVHPLSNNIINTNIVFQGNGQISTDDGNHQILINYEYEYLNEFWFGKSITATFNGN